MDKHLFSKFYLRATEEELVLDKASEAFIQYREFRINLLTGEKQNLGVTHFFKELEEIDIRKFQVLPIVIHLFYEFGHYCQGQFDAIEEHRPLGIYIKYNRAIKRKFSYKFSKKVSLDPLELPSFKAYKNKFEEVYAHLRKGNCYQVNLTHPFVFRPAIDLSPADYFKILWKDKSQIGAYSHGTYIDSLGKLFLSNSPECLFQVVKKQKSIKLRTMPIKGTASTRGTSVSKAWKKLLKSKKDEGELNMITDLMRNDLTKVSETPAIVLHKKFPLIVPGLIHQFSVIETKLKNKVNLGNIVEALFPGGSITGAPKKRVMEIIKHIEKINRGFYCGSTILLHQNSMTASINIRSVEVDFSQDEILYGAGGGVTLLSDSKSEYEESLEKLKSFLLLFSIKN